MRAFVFQVNLESSAMEEILKFGEFSSLLNKSHSANNSKSESSPASAEDDGGSRRKGEEEEERRDDEDDSSHREKDNRGCQVENGQDIV